MYIDGAKARSSLEIYGLLLSQKYGRESKEYQSIMRSFLTSPDLTHISLLARFCIADPDSEREQGKKPPALFIADIDSLLTKIDFDHAGHAATYKLGDGCSRKFGHHLYNDLLAPQLGKLYASVESNNSEEYLATLGNPKYSLNETKFQRIHTSHITRRALIGK
jgi:hypothetical protein